MSDWKYLVEGLDNVKVAKNLKVVPHPYTKKNAVEWINHLMKNWKKKNKDDYTFFIELKSERKVIGSTGVHAISKKNSKCTTGSWINEKYWGKGYIMEAKVPILDFIFDKLKLRKIETSAWRENERSNRMSKKLGFKQEGMLRKSVADEATKKIHDVIEYGIFKGEWKKARPRIIKELNKKIKNEKH